LWLLLKKVWTNIAEADGTEGSGSGVRGLVVAYW